jgi:DNA-binding response OmpR family regulator
MGTRILIVDDSKSKVYRLTKELEHAGYEVSCAYDGIEALQLVMQQPPHLILLDYEMPKLDGMNVIQRLRAKGIKIPIILMTVHNSNTLHIKCLKLGSNDYLTIPIESGVLLARIEARLKEEQELARLRENIKQEEQELSQLKEKEIRLRELSRLKEKKEQEELELSQLKEEIEQGEQILSHMRAKKELLKAQKSDVVQFSYVKLDTRTHSAYCNNQALTLTMKEYKLLEFFLRNPQQVLERAMILERIWGNDSEVISNVIDAMVSNLREKLEVYGETRIIHTIRGVGYILKESHEGRAI